jgi:hypothetical protein
MLSRSWEAATQAGSIKNRNATIETRRHHDRQWRVAITGSFGTVAGMRWRLGLAIGDFTQSTMREHH